MTDSSENENELNVNEIVIKKDVENLKSANFRTKNNVVKRNEEKNIQTSFENLYVQRRTWRRDNRNVLWTFYCVNDVKDVDGGSPQVIRCILCHNPPILEFNSSTKESKGLITHYKTYWITTLRKHVDANHFIMLTKIEEEVNNAIRRIVEKQPTRRGLMC